MTTQFPLSIGAPTNVIAGRVTTLELTNASEIEEVRILKLPEHGNVTVNPDNTLALVLTGSDHVGNLAFEYEVTYADGETVSYAADIDAVQGPQDGGWGTGEFYLLQEDDDGSMIIEHGENHRVVHVSGDADALSLADIAALEGKNVEDITGHWLSEHPEYGATPEMALKSDAGMKLWYKITDKNADPNSHWLLFERGFEYEDLGRLVSRGTLGESELHPQLFGAYGEGAKPILDARINMYQEYSENIVFQDVALPHGGKMIWGKHAMMDNVSISNDELNIKGVDYFTLRNSDVTDVYRTETVRNTEIWEPAYNRISGAFFDQVDGLLLEGNFFDHNGWADGYSYDMSAENPQSPSYYNHNIYIQNSVSDVTVRDNITMRASSFGATIRPGAHIEDNVFLDNNAGLNSLGGDYKDAGFIGNYTFMTDNVITSGAHKTVDDKEGALTMGAGIWGRMSTLMDNIVAHLSDPNNPEDGADKEFAHFAVRSPDGTLAYEDTKVYNWSAERGNNEENADRNIEGLDTAVLDETTIQNFTAALLGKETATISDLADFLRTQYQGDHTKIVDADLIIDFFQSGFGMKADLRSEAETLRFVPNELSDGVRWDNRANWSTDDLPGTQDGDSVDLAGNWVNYGGTTTLEDLSFGDRGALAVNHGYLKVADHIAVGDEGAVLSIDRAGQLWADGYTDQDMLTIEAAGGRFANTDLWTGTVDMNVSDNAEVILASDGADFALNGASSLQITGSDAKVGFDGEAGGTGVLLLADDAKLSLVADAEGFSAIREFTSGHFDDAGAGIQSGVNLGNVDLKLDVAALTGASTAVYTLIDVDEIIGNIETLEVSGLAENQDATVKIDYSADKMTLTLTAAGSGSGKVVVQTSGNEEDAKASASLGIALDQHVQELVAASIADELDRINYANKNFEEIIKILSGSSVPLSVDSAAVTSLTRELASLWHFDQKIDLETKISLADSPSVGTALSYIAMVPQNILVAVPGNETPIALAVHLGQQFLPRPEIELDWELDPTSIEISENPDAVTVSFGAFGRNSDHPQLHIPTEFLRVDQNLQIKLRDGSGQEFNLELTKEAATICDNSAVRRFQIEFEWHETSSWPKKIEHYDSLGQLILVEKHLSDGITQTLETNIGSSSIQTTRDTQNVEYWSVIEEEFDSNGELFKKLTKLDSGVVVNDEYEFGVKVSTTETDEQDNNDWSSIVSLYSDALITLRETDYDNGALQRDLFANGNLSISTMIDKSDQFEWHAKSSYFSDSGAKRSEIVQFDDGSQTEFLHADSAIETTVTWDAQGLHEWAFMTSWAARGGQAAGVILSYEDETGSI